MSTVVETPVWAAGAVPLRGKGSEREVLLAHRPSYDDWVLPKGKVEPGELLPKTAVREVAEEVAALIRLGVPLSPIRYPIPHGTKIVSWWIGVTSTWAPHSPNSEVDNARWHPIDKALKVLTYADERSVLAEAATMPDTTPLIMMRHAKAMSRSSWTDSDRLRPLETRGKAQLPYVAQILTAFAATRLFSSPATRCVQTLTHYADDEGLQMATDAILSEENDSMGLRDYTVTLAREVGKSGVPTAICSHGPMLSDMVDALGMEERPLATASCVIAHLDVYGAVVRAEWHDTLRAKVK